MRLSTAGTERCLGKTTKWITGSVSILTILLTVTITPKTIGRHDSRGWGNAAVAWRVRRQHLDSGNAHASVTVEPGVACASLDSNLLRTCREVATNLLRTGHEPAANWPRTRAE